MSSHYEGSKAFSNSNGILLEESSMFILYGAATISLIAIIVICVCGCRKSIPKNELLGLAGKVKITNPESVLSEEPVSSLESSIVSAPDEVDSPSKHRNATDSSINSVAGTGVATATRSLPDLPFDPNRPGDEEGWDKNGEQNSGGDTGSDLYATVEEHKMAANGRLNKKASQSTSAVLERNPSGSYASPTTDGSVSPYACYRKENPYDKVKQENPYAQVTTTSKKKSKLTREGQPSVESTTSTSSSRSQEMKEEAASSPPPPTIRTRRHSWDAESSSTHSSIRDTIPAAGAISGAVAASNELPYMTPPIISTATDSNNPPAGPHFSGDSQDSGKGYTCISVREPLSNISRPRRTESSHYTTVSDDSDETYEAIEEPSGSEIYAKIAPIARFEVSSPPVYPVSPTPSRTSPFPPHSPPPNPHAEHSRQSSNSSQANGQEVDSMYAKVMKMSRKKSGGPRQRTESFNWPVAETDHNASDTRSVDMMFPVSASKPDPYKSHSSMGYERITNHRHSVERSKDPYESITHSTGYERIKNQRTSTNKPDPYESHSSTGYERITKRRSIDEDDMDPNYEAIQKASGAEDMGYAQIQQRHMNDSYEQRDTFDAGYEQIHKTLSEDLEAAYDMGYERIHARQDTYERIQRDDIENDIGYEQIHKAQRNDNDIGYEKVHKTSEHYEKLHGHVDVEENDPNYEELKTSRHTMDDDDPNYEVLSTVCREPLANTDSHNYASINKGQEKDIYATVNKEPVQHNYASINKYNKRKYRQSDPINNNESTYECMNDCLTSAAEKEESAHKRSNSVSRIEVEPNVFYSQVQKLKR